MPLQNCSSWKLLYKPLNKFMLGYKTRSFPWSVMKHLHVLSLWHMLWKYIGPTKDDMYPTKFVLFHTTTLIMLHFGAIWWQDHQQQKDIKTGGKKIKRVIYSNLVNYILHAFTYRIYKHRNKGIVSPFINIVNKTWIHCTKNKKLIQICKNLCFSSLELIIFWLPLPSLSIFSSKNIIILVEYWIPHE